MGRKERETDFTDSTVTGNDTLYKKSQLADDLVERSLKGRRISRLTFKDWVAGPEAIVGQ